MSSIPQHNTIVNSTQTLRSTYFCPVKKDTVAEIVLLIVLNDIQRKMYFINLDQCYIYRVSQNSTKRNTLYLTLTFILFIFYLFYNYAHILDGTCQCHLAQFFSIQDSLKENILRTFLIYSFYKRSYF